MDRLLVVVAVVALASASACGSRTSHGPAWPAPSTTAEDGGESLEPRPSATYAAALEKSEDKVEEKKPAPAATDDKPVATATATDDKPAAASDAPSSTSDDDEILMTDEIVIEIED